MATNQLKLAKHLPKLATNQLKLAKNRLKLAKVLGPLWPFRGAIQPACEKDRKSLEMGFGGLPAPGGERVRKELKTS